MLELHSGSIEKFGVYRGQIEFFQSNCAKLGAKHREFNGQLRVKSHELEAKDQNKKGTQSQGYY